MATRVTNLRNEGDYMTVEDRLLVLDFQAGHPEAFVEIHRRYGGLAKHVCRRFLPNAADADEAFQESMIRVFQGLHQFNGRYALQPWVARIATNVSLDSIRSHSRRPLSDDAPIEEHERPDPSDGPEELYDRLVERDLVLSVLAGLPDTHRRALVLRELDGASHKEIAEDMGMSTAQAKALIHRAKGSFRRHWMQKVAERNRIAGFALLPLVWALRLADVTRRAVDRLGVAVTQAAPPELITSTSSAASNTLSMGERVVAAGVTLLVAGGVTVGAATIAKHRADRQDRVVAATAPLSPAPAPTTAPRVHTRPNAPARDVAPKHEEPVAQPPVVVDPSVDPTVAPSPTTDPTPTPSPSPDPPPSPTPVVPPAPDWSGSFDIDWASQDLCSCGPGVTLVSSQTDGDLRQEGATLLAVQKIEGAALDAEGDAAWGLSSEFLADLTATDGTLRVSFTLGREGVQTSFIATAAVANISGDLAAGEPAVYAFSGSYAPVGPSVDSPIATSGAFQASITVWADGSTVTTADISLFP